MPAYFPQQKEIYLYVRLEENSVEAKSHVTWFNPRDHWSASGMNYGGFCQLPAPSSSAELTDHHRARRGSVLWLLVASSSLWDFPWIFSRKASHWDAAPNVGVTGLACCVNSGNPWTGIQSPVRPPGNIMFHTKNNRILPAPRGNILELFEVKENYCLLGKKNLDSLAVNFSCLLSDTIWIFIRIYSRWEKGMALMHNLVRFFFFFFCSLSFYF